jgi:16S rRNA processing protein RimM
VTVDECFQLGYIIKPHGLKGEVDIFIDSDFPDNYTELESVFVSNHDTLIPFFIEYIQVRGQKAIVKFEEIDAVEQSSELKGNTLHLPLSNLPPLVGNEFYFHEVLGFHVLDKKEGDIGPIHQILNYPNQDFMVILKETKEILIPINNDIITEVDKLNRTMSVDLPEGLLDIYL